jgi:hypothetical protein
MTAQSQDQSEPLPGTVFNPRQVRMLKVAIAIMSIALVLGFALLIIGMVQTAGKIGKDSTAAQPATPAPSSAGVTAGGFELKLEPGQSISGMALGDNRIAVHVTGPEGAEIRIIDLGSGAVAAQIPVTRE